jgi:hypothetical protein
MKLGLDFHGVVDKYPQALSDLTRALVWGGNEVHIITGQKDGAVLRKRLAELNIHYTHIFSITSFHEENGTAVEYDERGEPWMDMNTWNRTKGSYCKSMNIDIHLDDSPVYGEFFENTAYFFIQNKEPTNVS